MDESNLTKISLLTDKRDALCEECGVYTRKKEKQTLG